MESAPLLTGGHQKTCLQFRGPLLALLLPWCDVAHGAIGVPGNSLSMVRPAHLPPNQPNSNMFEVGCGRPVRGARAAA